MTPQTALRYGLALGPVMVVALWLYVRTLLPDVGTWDTAEFQAIGPVLGIAHPTGYPTYTLLAWLASVGLQPFGNEAYRADLLSALLVAAGAGLTAVAVVQVTRRWLLGVLAGLALAVTPVAWSVAIRADAHALHLFFAALLLVLLIRWQQRVGAARGIASGSAAGAHPETDRSGRWLVAAAVVFGLSLGNHALTLLLAPGIAAYVLLVAPRIAWRRWRLVLVCLAALALTTVAVYAYLPIRSAMDPPLDYADPESWEAFWYVVLGQQFQASFGPLPSLAEMVSGAWEELVRDLGPLVVLVPAGALLGLVRHARLIVLTGLWFAATWVFALGYPNAAIERYYLVPLMAACVWLALAVDVLWDGLAALLPRSGPDRARPVPPDLAIALTNRPEEEGRRNGASRPARAAGLAAAFLVAVLVALVLLPVPERLDHLDASGDTHGREWLEATLGALEPNAVIVSWWSYSTPLWYGRWVEGRRPDIHIIDDRDVIDDGYAGAAGAIERFLGERPVYVIRLAHDLPPLAERYELQAVAGIPGPGDVYRVRPKEQDGAQPLAEGHVPLGSERAWTAGTYD